MGVSSAMYAAVTGLAALGTGMQTISNNIANVNTVGFKAGRTNFEDLISQDYWSNGKTNQIGRGVKVASIQQLFTQGSFMNTSSDTDMAIAGDGFFSVRDRNTNDIVYTRNGAFTFDKEGNLEMQGSGYVLQGWELSVPKPGADPVRIGAPKDVQVVILNAPPVETSQLKVVTQLNADDKTAYPYEKYLLADEYGDQVAIPLAKEAKTNAYNAAMAGVPAAAPTQPQPWPATFANPTYQTAFNGYLNGLSPAPPNPITDQNLLNTAHGVATSAAKANAEGMATTAYDNTLATQKKQAEDNIKAQLSDWVLEGAGFAGAWDATNTKEPIAGNNYTYPQDITIYDSLGNAHDLMVYYQPNPHMDNVWDYLITCNPVEDARKDNMDTLFMEGASFAGLIQKGKITFTADGDDRHGGMIKDIEAQNLDLSRCRRATTSEPVAINSSATPAMSHAKIGGYFNGSSTIDPSTGNKLSSARTYTVMWVGNIPSTGGNSSGFVWWDNANPPDPAQYPTGDGFHFISVPDRERWGPYPVGSGLSITFDEADQMKFTAGDTLTFTAYSEATAWTNLQPNQDGYFDFDVAFVQSASMALHPPYPANMPTITQHIAMDMGAKNPYGQNAEWTLDKQSTTQYASKSVTLFSSQDGYPAGSLQRVSIDKDGILTGVYTNGRQQPLYQIGLARFLNPNGLAKLGDNVYQTTRWSGEGTINPPGYGGTGTVRANFLEQSNVDLADEIVNMIVTQRGFQANSKVVTTTDTMLAEVIEMKR